jgi:hippurate hydrolase
MPFDAGTVVVSPVGVSAPAADYFKIRVRGKGCHGSMPNVGVDPLTAAAHILIALQELSARELGMNERAVLTIGTLHGGTVDNAISDSAEMGGSIRTFNEETRKFLKERLVDISEGIAKTFRAEAVVSFGSGCPTLKNDEGLVECAERYSRELLGDEKTFSAQQLSKHGNAESTKTAGSEDFAYVSQRVPSVMLAMAAGQPEKGYSYPQHHPMVRFDEEALCYGCAIYAYVAMRWLEENS